MRNKYILLTLLLLLTSNPIFSAGEGGAISVLTGFVRKVGTFIDSLSVRGVDRNYIDAPKQPWQAIIRGNINQSDMKMESTLTASSFGFETTTDEYLKWEPHIKTVPSTYAGIWLGYRGYGLGYSWNVGGDKGNLLTIGATGGSFGINLRVHRFENDEPEVFYSTKYLDDVDDTSENLVYESGKGQFDLITPINIHTLILDGYYLFNGKYFSYAAAYDQSVIQKRSAGSLMAGFMYYHSHIQYASDDNADFIFLMSNIGRIKQWQLSAGAGYAYNLVPCKGLLISAMFMPMLTFYNNNKISLYDSNYRQQMISEEDGKELDIEDWRIYPMTETSKHSKVSLNFDARLSVTYNWKRFFANIYGQFSQFPYRDDNVKGRLNDWYVNAALGVRL